MTGELMGRGAQGGERVRADGRREDAKLQGSAAVARRGL